MPGTDLAKVAKGGGPANPLDEKREDIPLDEIQKAYDDTDKEYLSFLQQRLENAKRQKLQPYTEWGGKNYYQIYQENEAIANTILPKKINDDDVVVSAGSVEQKLHALLANVINLDLSAEVNAYDFENNKIDELGTALTDIMRQSEEIDGGDGAGDDEKKIQRFLELLKQGTAFVQEEWVRRFEIKKTLKNKNYSGEFKKFEGYTEKLEKVFEGCSRNLLYGPNVYLGNIFEFYNDDQPFIFTAINHDFQVTKSRFGSFENFKYVQPGMKGSLNISQDARTIYDNAWRLNEVEQNEAEVIMYQDKFRDEFQIIINGVLMLPVGFPLSAVSPGGQYNIAKQVNRIISSKFAYGKSFVGSGSVKEIAALIDEMLKLSVLKTRKSFSPSWVNTSGKVISKRALSPGRINMGFTADSLQMLGDAGQGVTQSEVTILEKLQELLNEATVSDQFAGQPGGPGTTATEVLAVQKQAQLALGNTITVCTLFEKKLAYLRLWNILENWFAPTDEVVTNDLKDARELIGAKGDSNPDEDNRTLSKKFRRVSRDANLQGKGKGQRKVIPVDKKDDMPLPHEIFNQEQEEEKALGYPVQKIFISWEGLQQAKLTWFIVIAPREKESSPYYQIKFRDMLTDVVSLVNLGAKPSLDALEDEFSRVWQKSRVKLWQPNDPNGGAQVPPDMAANSAIGKPGAPLPPPLPLPPNSAGIPKAGGAAVLPA